MTDWISSSPIISPHFCSFPTPQSSTEEPILFHQQTKMQFNYCHPSFPIRRAESIFSSDSISIEYSINPHEDDLYQTNYHHLHNACLFLFAPPHHHPNSKTYYISSADLSSVQLLTPTIQDQYIRVRLVTIFNIYWLIHHNLSGYPILDQLLTLPTVNPIPVHQIT